MKNNKIVAPDEAEINKQQRGRYNANMTKSKFIGILVEAKKGGVKITDKMILEIGEYYEASSSNSNK